MGRLQFDAWVGESPNRMSITVSQNNPELGRRIAELRRRHFGARGKARIAEQFDLSADEWSAIERGRIPRADILVRLCELTGEDLQWLLTGVGARGTVVISGTRGRHQNLIARIAEALDQDPSLASPLEAFFDLLTRGKGMVGVAPSSLPAVAQHDLIPVFDADAAPLALPAPNDDGGRQPLVKINPDNSFERTGEAELLEPSVESRPAVSTVAFVEGKADDDQVWTFLNSPELASALPSAFGVRIQDTSMDPMLRADDVVIVVPGSGAAVGRPVLCKLKDEHGVRARMWLGESADAVSLGRLTPFEEEQVARDQILWSLEAVYCVRSAA
jgi:transcriptional regulator with XRE-family HTH domain